MAGGTPSREPEWFSPVRFCRLVLTVASTEFDLDQQGTVHVQPAAYKDAVEVVGKAVFTLQAIIRQKLRSLLLLSMRLLAGVVHEDMIYHEIFDFMCQGYLNKDIFNTTLTCFAIIGEIIEFLREFGIPLPIHWHHTPWVNIYQHRLRNELLANGGWEELVVRTRRRYADSGLYLQVRIFLDHHLPIPHVEEFVGVHPQNPVEFVQELFPVTPRSTELAIALLRELYIHRPDMIPSNQEMQLFV